ncbi:hypothetical protein GUJ93_ZPchr0002g26732 [Zizania palustris]|uniref:Uncharacterized protein n=1 Tax=Zizania palustris TaxID=103762 RepID=A0A8J5RVJ3_ZIZPA|nr:hypothetical protein GUJ93_ZPchr0002g26732 [Zizania palustris]
MDVLQDVLERFDTSCPSSSTIANEPLILISFFLDTDGARVEDEVGVANPSTIEVEGSSSSSESSSGGSDEDSQNEEETEGMTKGNDTNLPVPLDEDMEVVDRNPIPEALSSGVPLSRPFISLGAPTGEMVSRCIQIGKDLTKSDLVVEMSYYRRVDLASVAKVAFLQGFTLLCGAVISTNHQENSVMEDI